MRGAALRLSSVNRRSSPDTSPAGTECLDIFCAPPGDRDVISHALRNSSSDTKIPQSVRIAAYAGRGASSGIVPSECSWGSNLTLKERRSLVGDPWDLSAHPRNSAPAARGSLKLSDFGHSAAGVRTGLHAPKQTVSANWG
jgi:hypothetical protein